jgi:uncharacterized protein
MTFAQLPPNSPIFVDANTLVYHFQPHPIFGGACTALIKQIELQVFTGFTATHVLGEVAHRLMTMEASIVHGWSSKVIHHLRQNPSAIQSLTKFQQAVAEIPQLGIQVLPITNPLMQDAVLLSKRLGLLINDALIIAVMQQHKLVALASNDPDFDRVPGIARYGPA